MAAMDDIKFYLLIFLRRLPYFLIVATVISAISVVVAVSLPPAFVSQMRLVVEAPQIPTELAASTVRTPALEQLQIVEQRLLTRANLLDIARQHSALPNIESLTPDEIVRGMRARTIIQKSSGPDSATLMVVSFEASEAQTAAAVLNDYLTIIQEADAAFRRGRAGETLDFFAQEAERLDSELTEQGVRILAFKQQNTDALPDSLEFRLSKREELRVLLSSIEREVTTLTALRDRFLEQYRTTGRIVRDIETELSPVERELRDLEFELEETLLVFSRENPRVKLLQSRIELMRAEIAAQAELFDPTTEQSGTQSAQQAALDLQMAEIDVELDDLVTRRDVLRTELDALTDTIERTPEVAITLEELERTYSLLETQYAAAEQRLSTAQTGDLIESRSRGQRIAVIEQPNVPDAPTKPNRVVIAGGGTLLGIAAGLALVFVIELLNTSIRRPEDLVSRFGISPFTTVPYIRTRQQLVMQRGLKILMSLAILIGAPALIYAVHTYYLPIDLVAEKVMNRLGIRW